ncbi:hydantoinase/oxoprolinase family protein [Nocardia sp. CDC159]|uniref:Hydantoinase/oxoprolinase family protein n=1 Tax=Nocardia pulmonis TaxID=2951408 RepID=A0A9X2IWA2_9NOCA|nr:MULTISPECIES: hydantoinase/oxoprolinase family protein [Nocardia]MCM6774083.1 hydantoinase/oxoprolinase family protein [Nocardia pulmonis]MCM6786970.1 hydantoinase/oxoprolinase family protein [Nocardia sp. CDC159]
MRIGIDVGGTNTDAVLMDGARVVSTVKTPTTEDVTSGIMTALGELEKNSGVNPADVRAVMIGTTHFINALVEANRLAPTAALRLGLPATAALPPMVDWPESLVRAVAGRPYLCHGGFEYDGQTISDLDENEIRSAARDMLDRGVRSVAISSVFSPVSAEHETRAAQIIAAEAPGMVVSLSHEIGRLGLLQRENATIINAALVEMAAQIVDGLAAAVRAAGVTAPLYLSQNDGTLMEIHYARKYPVATFASGPTNSMRGAAFLSGLADCVVVDVGGTTTDVGVLQRGFPREAATEVVVAGVRTNFRMPDVISLGLGGGSLVRESDSLGIDVGPDSVGYRLTDTALVFGGDVLTATDIGVAAGVLDLGDAARVRHLSGDFVKRALATIETKISQVIDRMRTSRELPPVVVVGGGEFLVPDTLDGVDGVHRTEHFAVANAIGAAIAQIGGEVDRIYPLAPGRREAVLDAAKQEAVDRAVAGGADPDHVEIVDVDEVPIAYLPGNATRIRVKAVGDLLLTSRRGT